MIVPAGSLPAVHEWTIDEFNRVARAGAFSNCDVELVEGAVIDMSPMGTQHSAVVTLVGLALQRLFPAGSGFVVRYQLPLSLAAHSQPQPDLAVVAGQPRDFLMRHPTTAALVVEVADSSLSYDQTTKLRLYAAAGIPEYWIVNLVNSCVEVYTRPIQDSQGWTYQGDTTVFRGDKIHPLAASHSFISVDELLP